MLKKDDKSPPENPIFAYGYLFAENTQISGDFYK